MRFTSRQHSTRRGPRTGCSRYALASSIPEMAKWRAVWLYPNPAIWGKMNHIQCERLRPARSSETTVSKTVSWASTKRFRLYESGVIFCLYMDVSEIDTPALVVDLDVLEANLQRVAGY